MQLKYNTTDGNMARRQSPELTFRRDVYISLCDWSSLSRLSKCKVADLFSLMSASLLLFIWLFAAADARLSVSRVD